MRSKRGEGSRVGVVSVLSRLAGRGEDGEMMENVGRRGTLKGKKEGGEGHYEGVNRKKMWKR